MIGSITTVGLPGPSKVSRLIKDGHIGVYSVKVQLVS